MTESSPPSSEPHGSTADNESSHRRPPTEAQITDTVSQPAVKSEASATSVNSASDAPVGAPVVPGSDGPRGDSVDAVVVDGSVGDGLPGGRSTLEGSDGWDHLLVTLTAAFLRLCAIGFGLGLLQALWMFPDRKSFSLTNQLPVPFRNAALLNLGTWIGLILLGAAVYLIVRPRRDKLDRVHRVSLALSPLAWFWPLPLYFDWEVFAGAGLPRLVIAVIWAIGLERSLRHTFQIVPGWISALREKIPAARPRISPLVPRIGFAMAGAALVVYFATFCAHYTIMQHHRMMTTGFDLGIFDNLLHNLLQGRYFHGGVDIDNVGGQHIQFHANWLAYLFVPFYAISPRAETLLIMQAWIVALSAVPIYLLAYHRLKSWWMSFVIASAFLVHEALQGPVFYDFHFLTVSPFFIAWTVYFFDRGMKWPLLVLWICTLLLREDQGAIVSAAALVFLLMGHRPKWAMVGGVVGVAWLVLMRFWVMPMHGPDGKFQQHIGIFQAMVANGDTGFGGVIKTLVTNPVYSLNNVLEERKLEYVLLLATPFALLPFRHPRLLFLFAPAALFTLCTANYPPPVSKGFQYTMYWMPLLALGTILRLSEWVQSGDMARVRAGVTTVFFLSLALGFNGGALFQQNCFTGGFRRIEFKISEHETKRYEELRSLVKLIPPEADVLATEAVVPHVSNRKNAWTLRQGIPKVDYLILWKDEIRGGHQAKVLVERLGPLGEQKYGVIKMTDNFQLWKRGAPQTDNLKALRSVGHYRKTPTRPTPGPGKRQPRPER